MNGVCIVVTKGTQGLRNVTSVEECLFYCLIYNVCGVLSMLGRSLSNPDADQNSCQTKVIWLMVANGDAAASVDMSTSAHHPVRKARARALQNSALSASQRIGFVRSQ